MTFVDVRCSANDSNAGDHASVVDQHAQFAATLPTQGIAASDHVDDGDFDERAFVVLTQQQRRPQRQQLFNRPTHQRRRL